MCRSRVRTILLSASGFLFPITFYYLSPYLVLQAASEGIVGGSLVVFGVQFVTALFFGRAFCGWICPAGAVAEGAGRLRHKLFRRRSLDFVKYAVWAPWLGLIAFLAVRAGGLRRVDIGYQTWHGISVSNVYGLTIFAVVLLLVVGLTLLAGRRGFCHTLCWMAPFMILGCSIRDRVALPGLRLEVRRDACVSCGACSAACSMSLDVQAMVSRGVTANRECILCARCIDACPKGVLSLAWRTKQSVE